MRRWIQIYRADRAVATCPNRERRKNIGKIFGRGSAHTVLAPYWAEKLGKTRMTGFQASVRGGVVGVEVVGDRVRLTGRAVTTMRGELLC